jgi:hypothetical protein
MNQNTLKFVSLNKIFHYEDSVLSSEYDNIQDAIEEIISIHIDEIKSSDFYLSLK